MKGDEIMSNIVFKYYFLIACVVLGVLPLTAQTFPADHLATAETVSLYNKMKELVRRGPLFGHQDTFASGVNWKDSLGKSDIKDITGDYPAVLGWDLGKIEVGAKMNFDSVPISKLSGYVKFGYENGLINTFSWHLNNPVNPSQDIRHQTTENTIAKIFGNPLVLARYQSWLDTIANFFLNLRTEHGVLIPVIFRPFHENTGNWFWWGQKHCSPQEYKRLWRFTVNYLKNKRAVHNLLYAYSPSTFDSKEDYLERYPGDDYVDILGFDYYDKQNNGSSIHFVKQSGRMIATLTEIGREKNKLCAFAEVGLKLTPDSKWWTQSLLPLLQNSGLSYVLVWRNGNSESYWGTYPGQVSSADFMECYRSNILIFGREAKLKNLYDGKYNVSP